MPSSTYRLSVRSHVPVTVSLTSPLLESTAYSGARPYMFSQICVRVTQPPRVLPSADSRYRRSDDEAYRMDTVMLESHFGFAIGSLGEGVSAAWACQDARRPTIAAVRRIIMLRSASRF